MAAKQCKHEFKGHDGGVTCIKCGLKMTTDEYLKSLKPKEETKQEVKGE